MGSRPRTAILALWQQVYYTCPFHGYRLQLKRTPAPHLSGLETIAMALTGSDAILFSDSDTDNDHSSTTGDASRGSHTFGEASSTVPSAASVATASSSRKPLEPDSLSAIEGEVASVEESASTTVLKCGSDACLGSASKASGGRVAPPLRPPPKRAATQSDEPDIADVIPAFAACAPPPPPVVLSLAESPVAPSTVAPSSAPRAAPASLSVARKTPTVDEADNLETGEKGPETGDQKATPLPAFYSSSSPRHSVLSSTTPTSTISGGGNGGGGARTRSTLGRPGAAGVKVAMPIAGGRAAWNKFLATAAPDSVDETDDAAASTICASLAGENGAGSSTDGDSGCAAGNGTYEPDAALAARGPRGFKNPVGLVGPNKGPAGAFSGNSMWRLKATTSASAGRARAGVAANGHGGYSNPLAAMRGGGGSGLAAAAVAGGGTANPLAGLRGAAGMGGAGVANPLARGSGARPGGGMENPMLGRRGGAGNGAADPRVGGRSNGRARAPKIGNPGSPLTNGMTLLPPPPPDPLRGSRGAAVEVASRDRVSDLLAGGSALPERPMISASPSSSSSSSSSSSLGEAPPPPVVAQEGDAVGAESNGGASRLAGLGLGFTVVGNGGLITGLVPPPSGRRARALQQMERTNDANRDPGQARVASVVVSSCVPVLLTRVVLRVFATMYEQQTALCWVNVDCFCDVSVVEDAPWPGCGVICGYLLHP